MDTRQLREMLAVSPDDAYEPIDTPAIIRSARRRSARSRMLGLSGVLIVGIVGIVVTVGAFSSKPLSNRAAGKPLATSPSAIPVRSVAATASKDSPAPGFPTAVMAVCASGTASTTVSRIFDIEPTAHGAATPEDAVRAAGYTGDLTITGGRVDEKRAGTQAGTFEVVQVADDTWVISKVTVPGECR